MSRTYLAALGDVNDAGTWSGIPYHFLQAAKPAGLIDEGLRLVCDGAAWTGRRATWNFWRAVTGRGKGGYQYSTSFLEALWKPVTDGLQDQAVINCFQLYAPSIVKDQRIRKLYYIDMTLLQLFDFYKIRDTIGAAIVRESLDREKQGYLAAERVVCHSQWAAQSVINDYGIDPAKVHAIVPGANIDRSTYLEWAKTAQQPQRQADQPLKLVFVGKYWDRKGLDRLLEAIKVVHGSSRRIELIVIGCQRNDLPVELRDVPGVQWIDFIDKRRELQRFLHILTSADIGCLLSKAEAGGMVLREYHALGLIVLGTAVGGSPEHMFGEAGHIVKPDASPSEIAGWLVDLIDRPEELQRLRHQAWQLREKATWDATVSQLRTLML